jgi:hypothetical protein
MGFASYCDILDNVLCLHFLCGLGKADLGRRMGILARHLDRYQL